MLTTILVSVVGFVCSDDVIRILARMKHMQVVLALFSYNFMASEMAESSIPLKRVELCKG